VLRFPRLFPRHGHFESARGELPMCYQFFGRAGEFELVRTAGSSRRSDSGGSPAEVLLNKYTVASDLDGESRRIRRYRDPEWVVEP
jgi:hypothetical protein